MLLQNLTARYAQRPHLQLSLIKTFALHRAGKDVRLARSQGDTAQQVADALALEHNAIPFSFIIETTGAVAQIHPIAEASAHALVYGKAACGIALLGDLRFQAPTHAQHSALLELLAILTTHLGLDAMLAIRGHDELHALHDDAPCPGPFLDLGRVRQDVEDFILRAGSESLKAQGFVLGGNYG